MTQGYTITKDPNSPDPHRVIVHMFTEVKCDLADAPLVVEKLTEYLATTPPSVRRPRPDVTATPGSSDGNSGELHIVPHAEDLQSDTPLTPLQQVVLGDGTHEGVKVRAVKEDREFTFVGRVDGWTIKFDSTTGAEVARKAPAPKAEEPPATRPGMDPQRVRDAYDKAAEKSDAPPVKAKDGPANDDIETMLAGCETAREALTMLIRRMSRSDVPAWVVAHHTAVPGFADIDPDKIPGRVERMLLSIKDDAAAT